MNSTLKPVLPGTGVPQPQPQPQPQPGGQASPAKGNAAAAGANHAAHPQAAQGSLAGSLVGQNLTHPAPAPPPPPPLHAVPSMAPVSANMAQMAQNMSHHGNLSHVTQNSVGPPTVAVASPSKITNPNAPLSLVHQDKALALTRAPDKNEPDSTGQANGTVDCPKSGVNVPATLKPQNPEPNKDKQVIAKTSPNTIKSPEKPSSDPGTPQKPEPSNPVAATTDSLAQPKVAMANEAPEKSPMKPIELKPAPTADVAPTQSDSKPVPESANNSQLQENASTPAKQDAPEAESAKTDTTPKVEDKIDEPKVEKPQPVAEEKKEEVKVEKSDPPKKEESMEKVEKVEEKEKPEEMKVEVKPEVKAKVETKPKSTLKLATVTPPIRKRRQASPLKCSEGPSLAKKVADGDSTPDTRTKRNRTKVQPYQSPTPELAMATKLSASAGRATPTKPTDDKLIVFYKNEYLAVRNAEGGFYVCQTTQNVYRTTRKIKIRWLSQDKAADPSGETYKPDFYDFTDMECVLTTLSLKRAGGGGGAQLLAAGEARRARSILQRALAAAAAAATGTGAGPPKPTDMQLTEEHPDGLDLSLYKDESQLEKKSRKRKSSKSSPRAKSDDANDTADTATPVKKARTTPKRSPKNARKAKTPQPKTQTNSKRKSPGTKPTVATSKTATAVTEKSKGKVTPPKRTPAKQSKPVTPVSTPTRKGRRTGKELIVTPIVPTPSTSTGKTSRTPRKPPVKK